MALVKSEGDEIMSNGTPEQIERWRGRVDEKLDNLKRGIENAATQMSVLSAKLETIQLQVTRLVVQFGLGAFLCSAVVSVVVGVLIKVITR
jgi:hypothetical protein